MRYLLLLALLASPAIAQTPPRVGPLDARNNLAEIAAGGPTAQAAARANIGVSAAFSQGCGQLINGSTLAINFGTIPCSALQGNLLGAANGVAGLDGGSHVPLAQLPTIPTTQISGLAASATTDTTQAGNISAGTLPAARMPAPGASSLGGVQSAVGASHQWISGISTAGVPILSQPVIGDIAGAGSMASQGSGAVAITGGAVSGLSALGSNGPVALTGTGTSGQYDAQISVTGGGSVAGQGTTNYKSGFHILQAYDGSPQLGAGYQLAATEYWSGMGGATTMGGTLYATNGTITGNVNGNFVAQNQGSFAFGNGTGNLFNVADPGAPAGAVLTIKGPALNSSGDLVLSPQGGANRITVNFPDGSSTNGNNRGTGAVDLQYTRTGANQVASGTGAFIVGSSNVGSGAEAVACGFSNLADGTWTSMCGGQNGAANGRYGVRVYSAGIFSAQGDAQIVDSIFRGNTTGGAAVRLVANGGGTAVSTNCYNVPALKSAAMTMRLIGNDQTVLTKNVAWFNNGLISRSGNASSTTYAQGTATIMSASANTVTVSATADTTNGCINFTVTPDNADTWHFVLTVSASEVQ